MQKHAFLDSNNVLKTWGYVESNNPGDVRIAVPEDFDKEPGKWSYANGDWQPIE